MPEMNLTEAIAILEKGGAEYVKKYKCTGRHLIVVRLDDAQLIALATTLARGNDTPEGKGEK